MSREPHSTIYSLGRDEFGRMLELIEQANTITLVRHAANQRDETIRLDMSREQANAIIEVLRP
jgi:hypothetical protein